MAKVDCSLFPLTECSSTIKENTPLINGKVNGSQRHCANKSERKPVLCELSNCVVCIKITAMRYVECYLTGFLGGRVGGIVVCHVCSKEYTAMLAAPWHRDIP